VLGHLEAFIGIPGLREEYTAEVERVVGQLLEEASVRRPLAGSVPSARVQTGGTAAAGSRPQPALRDGPRSRTNVALGKSASASEGRGHLRDVTNNNGRNAKWPATHARGGGGQGGDAPAASHVAVVARANDGVDNPSPDAAAIPPDTDASPLDGAADSGTVGPEPAASGTSTAPGEGLAPHNAWKVQDVLERIAAFADVPELLQMRRVSSTFLDAILHRVFDAHVDPHVSQPASSAARYAGPTVGCKAALPGFLAPHRQRMAFVATAMLCPLDAPSADDQAVSPDEDPALAWFVAPRLVLDLCADECATCRPTTDVWRNRRLTAGARRLRGLRDHRRVLAPLGNLAATLQCAPRLRSLSLTRGAIYGFEVSLPIAPLLAALVPGLEELTIRNAVSAGIDRVATLRSLQSLTVAFAYTRHCVSPAALCAALRMPSLCSLTVMGVTTEEWNGAVALAEKRKLVSQVRTLSVTAWPGALRLPATVFRALVSFDAPPHVYDPVEPTTVHFEDIAAMPNLQRLHARTQGARRQAVDAFFLGLQSIESLALCNPLGASNKGVVPDAAEYLASGANAENVKEVTGDIAGAVLPAAALQQALPNARTICVACAKWPATAPASASFFRGLGELRHLALRSAFTHDNVPDSFWDGLKSASKLESLAVADCPTLPAIHTLDPAIFTSLRCVSLHATAMLSDEATWSFLGGLPVLTNLTVTLDSAASFEAAMKKFFVVGGQAAERLTELSLEVGFWVRRVVDVSAMLKTLVHLRELRVQLPRPIVTDGAFLRGISPTGPLHTLAISAGGMLLAGVEKSVARLAGLRHLSTSVGWMYGTIPLAAEMLSDLTPCCPCLRTVSDVGTPLRDPISVGDGNGSQVWWDLVSGSWCRRPSRPEPLFEGNK